MKALLLLAALPACALGNLSRETESSRFSVMTDKREYLAEPYLNARPWKTYLYRARIVTKFTNTSSRPVYIDHCPFDDVPLFELDTVAPNGWWNDRGTMWGCGGSEPMEVLPGKTRIDTLTVEGPNRRYSTGEVFGKLGGTYRVGLIVRGCHDGRCPMVDSIRFSNPFTIHEAAGIAAPNGSLAGCYLLQYVDWNNPPRKAAPPSRFRLYAARGSQTPRARPVIPLGDSSLAYWVPSAADSIVVSWRSEFSGYRLRLKPDGGLLSGVLENFSIQPVDIVNPIREDRLTDAVARRVECDRTFDFH